MDYILPKPLNKGDKIAVIAPSGCIANKENILRAEKYFNSLGYELIFSKHLFSQDRYMSASDDERLEDLHNAFSDNNISAIICARGGYGALRLINKIDYDLIKNNPKIFCGYSDITILSSMFLKKAGLVTYSSPMINGDFGKENIDKYTVKSFFKAVTQNKQALFAEKTIKSGKAEGIMWGGNLTSLVSLAGLNFIPDDYFIFFAEDLNEPVYKIDRMLTQLLNIENFRNNIKGIAFGKFLDVKYPEQVDYLFNQIADELQIPVASGFEISHEDTKATIPYGLKGILEDGELTI